MGFILYAHTGCYLFLLASSGIQMDFGTFRFAVWWFERFNPCFVIHGSSLFMSAGVFVQARRYGS